MTRMAILFLCVAIPAIPASAQNDPMHRSDMKGMESNAASTKSAIGTHQATGVVKTIDSAAGVITIAHEPIKTLGLAGDDHGVQGPGSKAPG